MMSSKKRNNTQTNKNADTFPSGDNKPEMLILPPNLLQKLGINLGNIPISEEKPSAGGNFKIDCNIIKRHQDDKHNLTIESNSSKEKESSLLETATLMQKSVFLSPTFINPISNLTTEEIGTDDSFNLESGYALNIKNNIQQDINFENDTNVSSEENKTQHSKYHFVKYEENVAQFGNIDQIEINVMNNIYSKHIQKHSLEIDNLPELKKKQEREITKLTGDICGHIVKDDFATESKNETCAKPEDVWIDHGKNIDISNNSNISMLASNKNVIEENIQFSYNSENIMNMALHIDAKTMEDNCCKSLDKIGSELGAVDKPNNLYVDPLPAIVNIPFQIDAEIMQDNCIKHLEKIGAEVGAVDDHNNVPDSLPAILHIPLQIDVEIMEDNCSKPLDKNGTELVAVDKSNNLHANAMGDNCSKYLDKTGAELCAVDEHNNLPDSFPAILNMPFQIDGEIMQDNCSKHLYKIGAEVGAVDDHKNVVDSLPAILNMPLQIDAEIMEYNCSKPLDKIGAELVAVDKSNNLPVDQSPPIMTMPLHIDAETVEDNLSKHFNKTGAEVGAVNEYNNLPVDSLPAIMNIPLQIDAEIMEDNLSKHLNKIGAVVGAVNKHNISFHTDAEIKEGNCSKRLDKIGAEVGAVDDSNNLPDSLPTNLNTPLQIDAEIMENLLSKQLDKLGAEVDAVDGHKNLPHSLSAIMNIPLQIDAVTMEDNLSKRLDKIGAEVGAVNEHNNSPVDSLPSIMYMPLHIDAEIKENNCSKYLNKIDVELDKLDEHNNLPIDSFSAILDLKSENRLSYINFNHNTGKNISELVIVEKSIENICIEKFDETNNAIQNSLMDSSVKCLESNTEENKTIFNSDVRTNVAEDKESNIHIPCVQHEDNSKTKEFLIRKFTSDTPKEKVPKRVINSRENDSLGTELFQTKNKRMCEKESKNTNMDNEIEIPLDKVKEIANYLSGCRNFITKITNSKSYDDTNDKSLIKSKHNKVISKNFLQGVEKPGGLEIVTKKPLRTYKKNKNIKISHVIPSDSSRNILSSRIYDIDCTIFPHLCDKQIFCICSDFGCLRYYDSYQDYEHIHFYNPKVAERNSEIIFSIYDENNSIPYTHDTYDDVEKDHKININICCNICELEDCTVHCNEEVMHTLRVPFFISKNTGIDLIENTLVQNENNKNIGQDGDFDSSIQKYSSSKISNINQEPNETVFSDIALKEATTINANADEIVEREIIEVDEYFSKITENQNDTLCTSKDICESDLILNKQNDSEKETEHRQTHTDLSSASQNTCEIVIICDSHGLHDCENINLNENSIDNNGVPTDMTDLNLNDGGILYDENVEQKTQKRKRSDSTNVENSVKKSMKCIECGVCRETVAEPEWEQHKDVKHCFIAWKNGDSIDYEDKDLLNKLKKRRNIEGILKCTMCGTEKRNIYNFIRHVKKCIKSKDVNENEEEASMFSSAELSTATEKILAQCAVCLEEVSDALWKEHIGKKHNYKAWKIGEKPLEQSSLSIVANDIEGEIPNKPYFTCAVCHENVIEANWYEHIEKKHFYLAWKQGEPALNVNNEEEVWKHLYYITLEIRFLKCAKCGLIRKYAKSFMQHVKGCDGNLVNKSLTEARECAYASVNDTGAVNVKCGVCHTDMLQREWYAHIQKEHNYLAWQEGQTPLDLDDDEQVRDHLHSIVVEVGALKCAKCGLMRKYAKLFMQHIKDCTGNKQPDSTEGANQSLTEASVNTSVADAGEMSDTASVKCGVCKADMSRHEWYAHIQQEHNYLAWQEGQTSVDLDDNEQVRNHLHNIFIEIGPLKCAKCGLMRKCPKLFMQHIKYCSGKKQPDSTEGVNESLTEASVNTSVADAGEMSDTASVKCGVCKADMSRHEWYAHIQQEHNYLAWQEGQTPLDLEDNEQVRDHLHNIVIETGPLKCAKCGLMRKYAKLFMQHIRDCSGKKDPDSTQNINESVSEVSMDVDTCDADKKARVKCGVCQADLSQREWYGHIQKHHNYLAWQEGQTPLHFKDSEEVRSYLHDISTEIGGLVCAKCGLMRKYAKSFMQHVKSCDESNALDSFQESNESITFVITCNDDEGGEGMARVTCGVCQADVSERKWLLHIQKEHNYLAWQEGQTPLDVDNEESVRDHLLNIVKKNEGLVCSKCGLVRKYVKTYMHHIESCVGDLDTTKEDNSMTTNSERETSIVVEKFDPKGDYITCAVCKSQMSGKSWNDHIAKEHNYMAWKEGETPLDIGNYDQVYQHLYEIAKYSNGLVCGNCGFVRKYVKPFLHHIESCEKVSTSEEVECALCGQKMMRKNWKSHTMNSHYNVAWIVGDKPIDLKEAYTVFKYIKEYHDAVKQLVCKECGASRASPLGFYAHVIICGKTDEETERYKSLCKICDTKYLGVYKYQHMAAHKEQEYAKLRKQKNEEMKLQKSLEKSRESAGSPTGPRRAAQRAKSVIEHYKNGNRVGNKCTLCGFSSDDEKKFAVHFCKDYSGDSGSSVCSDALSENESVDTDIDSDISHEEERTKPRRKRVSDAQWTRMMRLPFPVKNKEKYLKESGNDFYKMHLCGENLFPEWRNLDYEVITGEQLSKYMPTVDESCKIRMGRKEWETYQKFEAKTEYGVSMFVGGSVQCVSWAPCTRETEQYLCVACHRGPDLPRIDASQVHRHPAMLQIWQFDDMKRSMPKFAFGLAHDFGTVWAFDWCPSGARDVLSETEQTNNKRLGLLAMACSNGAAYIFPVPYPSQQSESDHVVYHLKPCVELRLSRGGGRPTYQATSISWSPQKGHSTVYVGYSDGTTAFYDLECDSPLLMSTEGDVTVLYPISDERTHNTCVTGVGTFPGGPDESGSVVCSGSPTGGASRVVGAPGAGGHVGRALRSLCCTMAADFEPHWPIAVFGSDEALAARSASELEWVSGGRRLGALRAGAGCPRCARYVAYTPPHLRAINTHPVYPELDKMVLGMIQMTPLPTKRSKHKNDDLSMKIEPITYEDVIKKYGMEIEFMKDIKRGRLRQITSKYKDCYPERFPLSDVKSMAFCPSPHHHNKLAVATHAGFIFIVDT